MIITATTTEHMLCNTSPSARQSRRKRCHLWSSLNSSRAVLLVLFLTWPTVLASSNNKEEEKCISKDANGQCNQKVTTNPNPNYEKDHDYDDAYAYDEQDFYDDDDFLSNDDDNMDDDGNPGEYADNDDSLDMEEELAMQKAFFMVCGALMQEEQVCEELLEQVVGDGGEKQQKQVVDCLEDEEKSKLLLRCPKTCGVCDMMVQSETYGETQDLLHYNDQLPDPDTDALTAPRRTLLHYIQTLTYMQTLPPHHQTDTQDHKCENLDPLCTYWAALGPNHPDGCRGKDHTFMVEMCPVACMVCHSLFQKFCAKPQQEYFDEVPSLKEGGWNDFMERVLDPEGEIWKKYTPTVISRPSSYHKKHSDNEDEEEEEEEEEAENKPMIFLLHNILTPAECHHLITQGTIVGYRSSSYYPDAHDDTSDGTKGRTSTNTWLDHHTHPTTHTIMDRIVNITGMEARYAEEFQLLRYEVGQQYEEHHDVAVKDGGKSPAGERVMTVFLYLNDVMEGGETRFTQFMVAPPPDDGYHAEVEEEEVYYDDKNWEERVVYVADDEELRQEYLEEGYEDLVIVPQVGMALIWNNVVDKKDQRGYFLRDETTWHEALPVKSGLKYAANLWFHLYDFQSSAERGCENDEAYEDDDEEDEGSYDDEEWGDEDELYDEEWDDEDEEGLYDEDEDELYDEEWDDDDNERYDEEEDEFNDDEVDLYDEEYE